MPKKCLQLNCLVKHSKKQCFIGVIDVLCSFFDLFFLIDIKLLTYLKSQVVRINVFKN